MTIAGRRPAHAKPPHHVDVGGDDETTISPVDAAAMVERGEALLVDLTGEGAWATLAEVPRGSLRIAPSEFRERFRELPKARTVITYCT